MKSTFTAHKLDVAEFARQGAQLSGTFTLKELPRLAAFCVNPLAADELGDPIIARWQVRGKTVKQRMAEPQIWLYLEITAQVSLRCERCLQPVDENIQVERAFRFVATEEQAAVEDAQSEEDVLAISKSFDLLALCEDELILALPLMPLHAVCPKPLVAGLNQAGLAFEVSDDSSLQDDVEQRHPFAELEKLKKKLH